MSVHDSRLVSVEQELRQVLAGLELISHVSAARPGSSSRDEGEDIGGRRPPGGVDRRDDREHDHPQKSAEHFRRRLAHTRTDEQRAMILEDAQKALKSWRRYEPAQGVEPERGTLAWRRMIADSPDDPTTLAKRHQISKRTVYHYRKLYAEMPEAA